MKFDKLPIDNYFRFADPETNGAIHQRLSAKKIRDISSPGIITYRRNEEVQDLGADLEIAQATPIDTSPKFKDVPVEHFFRFKDTLTAYQKTSKYKIRRFTDRYDYQCKTRNNEKVEIFGNSMLDVPVEYRR